MTISTYTVSGMTCEHCVASVTEELGELTGVVDVKVDLASGEVSVTSEREIDRQDIETAVNEAGYQLAS